MNNRKDFLEWMRNKKKISFFESRKYLWRLDALNSISKVFSLTSAGSLPNEAMPEISLYAEFLNERFPSSKCDDADLTSNDNNRGTAQEVDELESSDITRTIVKDAGDSHVGESSNECQFDQDKSPINEAFDSKENPGTHAVDDSPEADAAENRFAITPVIKDEVADDASELEHDYKQETGYISSEGLSADQGSAVNDKSTCEIIKSGCEDDEIDYELFNDYLVKDSEKTALDGDYIKKKRAYRRLKKMSFRLLSDVYDNAFKASQVHPSQFEPNGEADPATLVFDIVSSQVADLSNGAINDMVSYVSYYTEQKEKKFLRNSRAFYYSRNIPLQESTATAFLKRNPSMDVIQRSIRDTIANKKKLAVGSKIICLVPDNLGDFRDTIKSQIRSSNSNVIQIPRSIATVYSFAKQYELQQDTSFVCYDYNSTDLCRTEIRVHYNVETGQHEFTRMRRQIIRDGQHYDFNKVANSYLSAYADKYQVIIPQSAVRMLIETRDILKIVARGQSIPVQVNDELINIGYDRSIVDNIATAIMDEVSSDDFAADYCCALLDLNTSVNGFCGLGYLLDGCRKIQERINRHEDIWIEYLPELSLEVIRDGTFDNLKLIDKGMIQKISETTMEEEVVIPLKDGRFSLPIGNGKVFCPLVREEYGNKQRDKMAMFDDEQVGELTKVFGEEVTAVQVDLTLTYHYGDPDSYKLTAAPCESPDVQIQSQWCDEEDQIMGNEKFPEYSSPVIKYRADINEVNQALQETIRRFSNSHNYTMTGGYNGNPPFDKFDHWLALKQVNSIRLSLPHIFSPANIATCSEFTIANAEEFLEKAISIYYDCERGSLDSGNAYFPCNLDLQSINKIKAGLLDTMSLMGGICVTSGYFQQRLIDDMVDCILGSNNLQFILALSTYISRDDDYYGVWGIIDELFETASGETLRHAIRSISAVCWRQPDWIYQLGRTPDHVLQSMIDTIIVVCKSELGKVSPGYNPRKVRDMLEAFLGISRLKETNSKVLELLNCNNKNIKSFVVFLKEFNETMRNAGSSLKYPFVSRLDMVVPDELHNVSNVLYPIIEILTDGNAIKLTGFTED